jgi:hypothetical protein
MAAHYLQAWTHRQAVQSGKAIQYAPADGLVHAVLESHTRRKVAACGTHVYIINFDSDWPPRVHPPCPTCQEAVTATS